MRELSSAYVMSINLNVKTVTDEVYTPFKKK